MVMQLRGCCCCCTLRTGTILIAVLGLLSGISFLFEGIFQTSGGSSDTPSNSTTAAVLIPQPTLLPALNVTGNGTDSYVVPGEHGFRVTQTIYGVFETVICALLLVGALRNSAKLIYPWIFASVILCIFGVIVFLGMGIVFFVADLVAFGVSYIIFGGIITAIHAYFILVVNSFHSTLKTGQVSRA